MLYFLGIWIYLIDYHNSLLFLCIFAIANVVDFFFSTIVRLAIYEVHNRISGLRRTLEFMGHLAGSWTFGMHEHYRPDRLRHLAVDATDGGIGELQSQTLQSCQESIGPLLEFGYSSIRKSFFPLLSIPSKVTKYPAILSHFPNNITTFYLLT